MLEGKNFVLNCDVCDARKINEDSLSGYEKIVINADIMLVNDHSREIFNRLPMTCNVDNTVDIEGDVNIITQNGDYEISGDTPVEENTFLSVNGFLSIRPGAEAVLKSYTRIFVNGEVSCPESIAPYLNRVSVNGGISSYPDDCVVLKPVFVIDKYFPVRAVQGARYYAKDKVILTDPQVDCAALASKGVRFVTERFLVAEEKLAEAVALVSEDVELEVVPQNWSYVGNSVTLDETLLQKYGSRLYIDGDLSLNAESPRFLSRIEELQVRGNVKLLKNQQEEFFKLNAHYGKIQVVKGRRIGNKASITLDNAMLDASPDGISIGNCAVLKIKKDVESKRILDLVDVRNCARVYCSPDQRSAVELVCSNVASFCGEGDSEEDGFGGIMGMIKQLTHSKVVNGDYYVL